MTVKLRYKAPDGDTSQLMSMTVRNRTAEMSAISASRRQWREFGFLLRQSELKGQATWSSTRELARRHRGEDAEGYRAEFSGSWTWRPRWTSSAGRPQGDRQMVTGTLHDR